MTCTRTTKRVVSFAASVALFAGASAGVAFAKDNGPHPSNTPSASSGSHGGVGNLTTAQSAAVAAARQAFLTSVGTIRTTFLSSLESIRTAIKAELAPLDTAKDTARTAYVNAVKANAAAAVIADLKAKCDATRDAYTMAFRAAKTKYSTQFATALATAKASLATAVTTYSTAVTAAFAPGSPPRAVQSPPRYSQGWLVNNGHHYGWLIGHLHDSDDD